VAESGQELAVGTSRLEEWTRSTVRIAAGCGDPYVPTGASQYLGCKGCKVRTFLDSGSYIPGVLWKGVYYSLFMNESPVLTCSLNQCQKMLQM
jgi:hypothetical protein